MQNNDYGIIWDVDGTLVDTATLHYAAWERLAQDLAKPFTQADFASTFGRRNPEIIRQLFGEHHDEASIADLGFQKEEYYRASARAGVEPLPGVRDLLKNLHEAGFRQAIGSSAPRQNLALIMELTGLTAYFEMMVGMEDTERGKPDPQVFLVAAAKLGLPPTRCLVMEDAVAGVQAAKAAKMACIAVSFVGVGHHSDQSLQAAGADLVVKTLQNVSIETIKGLLKQ